MTPAMRRLRELRDRQSRERQRMAELAMMDELNAETRAELDRLESGTPDLERQMRAAQTAADNEGEPQTRDLPDGERRERLELRSRASLTNYLLAAAAGRQLDGAELELQRAAGVNQIPVELFDVPPPLEQRADAATTAPSTVGINLAPIQPAIYARSIMPRLGVAMPRVESGTYATATVTTNLSAGARVAGAPQMSTAAGFTVGTTTPHSISARLSIRIEDVAAIGVGNF